MTNQPRFVCSLVLVGVLGAWGWAQQEAQPPAQQVPRGVVVVEEIPANGRDVRVGASDTFHLAGSEQILVRTEVGRLGEVAGNGEGPRRR